MPSHTTVRVRVVVHHHHHVTPKYPRQSIDKYTIFNEIITFKNFFATTGKLHIYSIDVWRAALNSIICASELADFEMKYTKLFTYEWTLSFIFSQFADVVGNLRGSPVTIHHHHHHHHQRTRQC